jgi:hypothetical protein
VAREIETPWGTAKLEGKLGQKHAALLEACSYYAEDWRMTDSEQIVLLVDPYKLRTVLSKQESGSGETKARKSIYSYEQTKRMFKDLKEATIEMTFETATQRHYILGGVLDNYEESELKVSSPGARIGKEGQRAKWRITLNKAYVNLIRRDLRLDYDPTRLMSFRTGVGQAVARHLLTHRQAPNGGWYIDGLLKAVGVTGTSTTMAEKRREVRSDREAFRELGYVFDDDDRKIRPATESAMLPDTATAEAV